MLLLPWCSRLFESRCLVRIGGFLITSSDSSVLISNCVQLFPNSTSPLLVTTTLFLRSEAALHDCNLYFKYSPSKYWADCLYLMPIHNLSQASVWICSCLLITLVLFMTPEWVLVWRKPALTKTLYFNLFNIVSKLLWLSCWTIILHSFVICIIPILSNSAWYKSQSPYKLLSPVWLQGLELKIVNSLSYFQFKHRDFAAFSHYFSPESLI